MNDQPKRMPRTKLRAETSRASRGATPVPPRSAMRELLHAAAILGLLLAAALGALGIAAWPPGGLMFALPYVFLFVGGLVAVASGVVFLMTRPRSAWRAPDER